MRSKVLESLLSEATDGTKQRVREYANNLIKQGNMEDVQDFIEEFYPGYHRSYSISLWNDLLALLDGEFEEDSSAATFLDKEYGGDLERAFPKIQADYNLTYSQILETAVVGYINSIDKLK